MICSASRTCAFVSRRPVPSQDIDIPTCRSLPRFWIEAGLFVMCRSSPTQEFGKKFGQDRPAPRDIKWCADCDWPQGKAAAYNFWAEIYAREFWMVWDNEALWREAKLFAARACSSTGSSSGSMSVSWSTTALNSAILRGSRLKSVGIAGSLATDVLGKHPESDRLIARAAGLLLGRSR